MKYAGLATTWLITLLVAVWLGIQLDEWLHMSFPIFTIVFPTAAVISLLWQIIKEFSKPKK
jgi:hypothetical protein